MKWILRNGFFQSLFFALFSLRPLLRVCTSHVQLMDQFFVYFWTRGSAKVIFDFWTLDFSFWDQTMNKVREAKPQTIDELKNVVDDFFPIFPKILFKMLFQHQKTCWTLSHKEEAILNIWCQSLIFLLLQMKCPYVMIINQLCNLK